MTRETLSNLGEIVLARRVIAGQFDPRRARNIILLLSASVALMMTGYGIVMPVFARRLAELGDGIEALGWMTVAFALSQLIAAPIMGGLADRRGRRPIILLALCAVMLSYIGYLLAPSTVIFIGVRAAAGFLTAGLFPAAMGVVADIVPEDRRAQWVGIVMGSYAIGMIFGPALGGFLYDGWGFAAPFVLSAGVAFVALLAAILMIPETRPAEVRRRETLRLRRRNTEQRLQKPSLWAVLPRPLYILGTLLFIDFIGSFAFAFVEPQMVFYMYDQLNWTTLQFGLVVGAYGVAMVFGQIGLGRLSDQWGRKPLIVSGLALNLSLYIGMAVLQSFAPMMIIAAIAGLGNALLAPAVSAFYLDITAEENRSRIVGIKESSLALGGVLGPLLVIIVAQVTTPQGVFWVAAALVFSSILLGAILLREPQRRPMSAARKSQADALQQRGLAAQASLRNIVMLAAAARADAGTHGRRKSQLF